MLHSLGIHLPYYTVTLPSPRLPMDKELWPFEVKWYIWYPFSNSICKPCSLKGKERERERKGDRKKSAALETYWN